VENRLTPEVEKTPEAIQDDMAHTRESLTEKVVALENQVVGTVQTAANTLTGTVDAVKSLITTAPGAVSDTVKQAASAVSEKMKEVFDITGHVRANQLTSVGVSTGLGFITGLLVFRGRETLAPVPMPVAAPAASAPAKPGIFDDLLAMLGRKVREVAENVIDSASKAVNQNVRDGVPKLVDAATEMAAERLTPTGVGPRTSSYRG